MQLRGHRTFLPEEVAAPERAHEQRVAGDDEPWRFAAAQNRSSSPATTSIATALPTVAQPKKYESDASVVAICLKNIEDSCDHARLSAIANPYRHGLALSVTCFERQPGREPLAYAVGELGDTEPALREQLHRFIGHQAERAAAIRDDGLVLGQLGEPRAQLRERQRARKGQMLLVVFTARAHVEHHDLALACLAQQYVAILPVPRAVGRGELAHRLLQLEQPILGEHAQRHPETRDIGTRD